MTTIEIPVKFVGIDRMNRPVFVSGNKTYYGSTDRLFHEDATVEDVRKSGLTENDLVWFGLEFDCEPMGNPPMPGLKIEW